MALNYSNLLTPNPKAQSLYGSLTQKTPAQNALSGYISPPLISPPVGSKSVGAVGSSGGYDTAPANPIKKIENKNTGVTTHYDTAGSYKGTPIKSGTDQQVSTQMKAIDNPTQQTQTPVVPPTVVPPTTQLPPPTKPPETRFGGLVSDITNMSKDTSTVDKANEGLLKLRQDYNTAIGNIEQTPIPLVFQQGREQVLGRQFASQEAAQQQALSNALTARGQSLGGLQGAAGLASPRSADIFVDPTTGQPIGNANNIGSALANWNAIRSTASTAGTFAGDYQTGLANLRAADGIGQQIISTLQTNPELNSQPLSAITNLKQLISGQVSSGPQQLLSQQIAQYIQTLGLDSNTVMNIASQQQGTLGQLLDSLRQQAAVKIESKNPQNIIGGESGQSGQGGQIINTSVGPVDNSWF